MLFLLHLVRLILTVTRYSTPVVSYQGAMPLLVLTQSIQLLTPEKAKWRAKPQGSAQLIYESMIPSFSPTGGCMGTPWGYTVTPGRCTVAPGGAQLCHGPWSALSICTAIPLLYTAFAAAATDGSHLCPLQPQDEGDNISGLAAQQSQSTPSCAHMVFRMHRVSCTLSLCSPYSSATSCLPTLLPKQPDGRQSSNTAENTRLGMQLIRSSIH